MKKIILMLSIFSANFSVFAYQNTTYNPGWEISQQELARAAAENANKFNNGNVYH
jgi:hypothetical protein